MSGAYGFDSAARWNFRQIVATGTADYALIAGQTGRTLMVQSLTINVTTSAAQAFDVESSDTGTALFSAPASLAVGVYSMDFGPLGFAIEAGEGIDWDAAAAGVGASVSGFGYYREA